MPTSSPISERPTAEQPDLRHALLSARADHAWWSSLEARATLSYALTSLSPLATRLRMDPADALSHAFEVWVSLPAGTLEEESVDLWAYTRAAVRRRLDREDEAARKITSINGIRRVDASGLGSFTSLDSVDIAYPALDSDEPARPASDPADAPVLAALEHVLILAGLDEDQRIVLTDALADIASTAPSKRACIAHATSAREMFDTPLDEQRWKNLVEVLLGTPSGKPGILDLARAGHPAPAMEPHISPRLMNMMVAA